MKEQGVETCFLIQIGQHLGDPGHHDVIRQAQLDICGNSEDIVLVSQLPGTLTGPDMMDGLGVHFTQKALNLIGEDAGACAGDYVRELKPLGEQDGADKK